MATLVDTAAALDLNKDDAAELKRQRLRDKKRRQRQKQKEKKKCLTERRATENKGQGLFATQAIEEGAIITKQPPALSVVFDAMFAMSSSNVTNPVSSNRCTTCSSTTSSAEFMMAAIVVVVVVGVVVVVMVVVVGHNTDKKFLLFFFRASFLIP